MLVISRKKNEAIVINHDITVVVVDIRGDKVRLGVEVPRDMSVHRQEVYDAIRRANAMPFDEPAPQARAAASDDDATQTLVAGALCSVNLTLTAGLLEMLDEIRGSIARQSPREGPTREQTAQALVEALQPFAGELAQARSLEDVRSFVALAVRGKSWR